MPHASPLSLASLLLAWPAVAAIQTNGASVSSQATDAEAPSAPAIDNLVHRDGYETAPLGKVGAAEGIGRGSREVILIAGFGMNVDVFRAFADLNLERYRMLLVTPAGYGDTPAPPMPVAPDGAPTSYAERTWCRAFERALTKKIAKRQIHRPVLIGFSDGAQHALRLALEFPEHVAAVVSIAGEPFRDFPEPLPAEARAEFIDTRMAKGWFQTVTRETWDAGMGRPRWYSALPDVGQRLYEASLVPSIPTMVRYYCEKWSYDPRPALARLVQGGGFDVPILALLPDPSELADDEPYQQFLRSAQVGPWEALAETVQVDLVPIEGARLGMLADHTEDVSRAVASFLDRLE